MATAEWNNVILAESDTYENVEGNIYFPPQSIKRDLFRESDKQTRCFWKGKAKYYDIEVNGKVNRDAAWYYPAPSFLARKIRDHVAFCNGVKVSL